MSWGPPRLALPERPRHGLTVRMPKEKGQHLSKNQHGGKREAEAADGPSTEVPRRFCVEHEPERARLAA